MQIWLILALASPILLSVATLMQKKFVRDSGAIESAVFFGALCTLVAFVFAISLGFSLSGLQNVLLNIAIMPFIYVGATIFMFKALKAAEASEVTIATTTNAIWVAIGSVLVLNEHVTVATIIGTLLVISSIIVISYRKGGIKLNIGLGFALIAALFFGIGFVNDAYILNYANSVATYTFLAFGLPAVIQILIKPSALKLFMNKERLSKMLVTAIFYTTSAFTIYLAYASGGPAAQIYPIQKVAVVLTVMLAAIFLKETDRMTNKLLALVLVFVGVLLLA